MSFSPFTLYIVLQFSSTHFHIFVSLHLQSYPSCVRMEQERYHSSRTMKGEPVSSVSPCLSAPPLNSGGRGGGGGQERGGHGKSFSGNGSQEAFQNPPQFRYLICQAMHVRFVLLLSPQRNGRHSDQKTAYLSWNMEVYISFFKISN